MANYATPIPENAQVTDAVTAATLGAPAPGINVGDPIHLTDISNARLELKKRKFYAEKTDSVVTEDELNISRRRLAHVSAVQGQCEYGGATPQWAIDLQDSVNSLNANFARLSQQRYNAVLHGDGLSLRALHKNRGGLGGVLPGFGEHVPNPPTAAAAVGTECPIDGGYFPATFNELGAMNMTRLNRLAMWYNESFGIVQGDDDQQRLEKFKNWCKF